MVSRDVTGYIALLQYNLATSWYINWWQDLGARAVFFILKMIFFGLNSRYPDTTAVEGNLDGVKNVVTFPPFPLKEDNKWCS